MGFVLDSSGSHRYGSDSTSVLLAFGANHEWRTDLAAKRTITSGALAAAADCIGSLDAAQATAGFRPTFSAGPPALAAWDADDFLSNTGGGGSSPIDPTNDFGLIAWVDTTLIPNDSGLHVVLSVCSATAKVELGWFPTGATTGLGVLRYTNDSTNDQVLTGSLVSGKLTICGNLSGAVAGVGGTLQVNANGAAFATKARPAGAFTHAALTTVIGANGAPANYLKGGKLGNCGTKAAGAFSLADTAAITALYAALYP